jgi:hypothetical protein
MNTKYMRLKILRRKHEETGYNLMKIVNATAKHDTNSLDKTTDAITISIPGGIREIQVEALGNNEINIFYKHNP